MDVFDKVQRDATRIGSGQGSSGDLASLVAMLAAADNLMFERLNVLESKVLQLSGESPFPAGKEEDAVDNVREDVVSSGPSPSEPSVADVPAASLRADNLADDDVDLDAKKKSASRGSAAERAAKKAAAAELTTELKLAREALGALTEKKKQILMNISELQASSSEVAEKALTERAQSHTAHMMSALRSEARAQRIVENQKAIAMELDEIRALPGGE